ncbi:MAG TPA: cyclase family protein [Euzebyales bacterium]|nr:cyclase family protein [Euzebyales bacterium]
MCLPQTSTTAPHHEATHGVTTHGAATHDAATHDAATHHHHHAAGPDVGRRSFLRGGAALAAGAAVTTLGAAGAAVGTAQPASATAGRRTRVVDLTHRFTTDFPTFTGVQPTRQDLTTFADDGFYSQRWTFGEHTATHIDAPGHFAPGQPLVDELDPDALIAPLVVVDIRRAAARDPNAEVSVDDLRRYERRHGRIPRGALVCMDSGWSAKAGDPLAFKGGEAYPDYAFPGFSVDAAMWLAQRRDVTGIGVDTMSLDPGDSTTFPVHVEFLATGRYGIEGVANLSQVRRRHRTAVVGVVPWQDGSGGPCRVLAF